VPPSLSLQRIETGFDEGLAIDAHLGHV
jgi:hypothetical protein